MSKFTLSPSAAVGSVHIKASVKYLAWGLGILILCIVMWVIAQKGHRESVEKEATPTMVSKPQGDAPTLEAILESKPKQAVVKAATPKERPPQPEVSALSKQRSAELSRQQAMLLAREAKLSEAINGPMNIQLSGTDRSNNSPSSKKESDELSQAKERLLSASSLEGNQGRAQNDASEADLGNNLVNQKVKADFLNTANKAGYLSEQRTLPMSDNELTVGTVIPAVLISAINSDTLGNLIAQVSQNVYNSATGDTLLIPQGTQLYGTYDSQVAYGQRRLPVTWSRVNFPDGTKLDIGAMASMDRTGKQGLTGEVNNHYWRLFGQATFLGGLSGLSQASVSDDDNSSSSTAESVADGVTQQYAETGNALIRKNMNIPPTIEIDNAETFYIMVSQDILLPPYTPIR